MEMNFIFKLLLCNLTKYNHHVGKIFCATDKKSKMKMRKETKKINSDKRKNRNESINQSTSCIRNELIIY